jgi:hypothetical protein
MSEKSLPEQGLISSGVEWAGDLAGYDVGDNTLDSLSAFESTAKDVVGLNSAMVGLGALSDTVSPFLGKAGPIGSILAGGANLIEGGAGLLDGEWNEADWGNAGKVLGGGLALGAGACGLGIAAAGGAAAATAAGGASAAAVVAAPYLAAGAATVGLGMRGNGFMNEHLGFGFGDAMGYGEGMASHATDGIASGLGLDEDGFAAGALGVVGGLADVATEAVTNPFGTAIDTSLLGISAGLGIGEDVGNLVGGLFGNADAGSDFMGDWFGEGTVMNTAMSGMESLGDLTSVNQWGGAAMDWMFGDDDE